MHHQNGKNFREGRGGPGRLPRRFWMREDGSTTVFATVVFVLMVGIGGIAIDVMRYETQRVQLQYTLDRAVLAAASLSQSLDPREVVENYFETAGLEGYRLRVNVETGVNFRRVEARAELETQTLFMSLFGQPVLTSPAAGAAEEWARNVEISLVLDISGSMWNHSRIHNLRPAARDFVTSVLAANDNVDGNQLVSVSIVPYDHAVNIGPELASGYALTNEHTYSNCVRFQDAQFTFSTIDPFVGLDPTVPLQRKGHFDSLNNAGDPIHRPVCRVGTNAQIIPWSNNEAQLHASINALNPFGFTASDQGMRWAVALLDPSARPVVDALVDNGTLHPHFEGRPASYADPETLKIVVLMTDGENTRQFDLRDQFRTGLSPFWRDPDNGSLSVFYPQWNEFWHERTRSWRAWPDGGDNNNAVQMDYSNLWAHISTPQLRSRMFHANSWQLHDNQVSNVNHWRRTTIQARQRDFDYADIIEEYSRENGIVGDARLRAICAAAQARGIVVFSIAFEAPPRGQTVMRECASSDSHYYDVRGLDISNAFASIARTIDQLRLVQ